MVQLQILGLNGLACIDTGSRKSIAGAQLYNILLDKGCPFTASTIDLKLADGESRKVHTKTFTVDVVLNNRSISSELIAIPQYTESRMLLGIDFIKKASMILDFSRQNWFFSDEPHNRYQFVQDSKIQLPVTINSVHNTDLALREDEGEELDESRKNQVTNLLEEFTDIFALSTEPTPYAEHTIKLTEDTPIAVPPYRLAPAKKLYLQQELEKMLAAEVIEECESPYAAPVVLVPKKDETFRICVDYRRLNEVTVPDRYPLPRIDDLLHAAKKTQFMTTIDLRSGYWQVPVKSEDQDKTAFTTPFGNYRWTRMPFGLRNAPSTFQRLMDRFRSGLKDIFVLGYLDDLIVISSSFEEHLQDLRAVFERLRLYKLHANRVKCHFVSQEIKYLGHVITSQGIKPDPMKISAIKNMKPPGNVKQLLTFLQTSSWFRRFVPDYASVAKPLSMLTRKNIAWAWEQEQAEAFGKLKDLLTSSPILQQADPTIPYILHTDASSYALGAVLLQGEGTNQRPVEYASRLLTSAEKNYSTTEREALAVVWAMEKFRGYIEGTSVTVISDHQPLRWLMSLKSPSGRLARWALSLQSYDMKVEYTPGRSNVVADTLSRPPYQDENLNVSSLTVDLPVTNANEIRSKQMEDPDLKKIIDSFENMHDAPDLSRWTERGYIMLNGILYRYPPDADSEEAMQVVPKSHIPTVLHEYHNVATAGHYGIEKTLKRISSRYYWVGMRRTITDYLKSCLECQRFKPTNMKPAGLLQTPVQHQRFEVLSMDLFGPLPVAHGGEQWIFVIEDTATRWVELFPLKNATAPSCARCLIDEVILRYGTPRRVISDNGSQFVSEVMQCVAHCLGFKQALIPAYHPESNPTERKNRDIKTQLSILVTDCHHQWVDKLPSIRFAMNSSVCQSTGFSPAYMCFGRELRTPDDIGRDLRAIIDNSTFVAQITPYLRTFISTLAQAREQHEIRQDHAKAYADATRRPAPIYKEGDKVLVTIHALSNSQNKYTAKFAPRRDGPYLIYKQISPTSYQIASPQTPDHPLGVYHVSAFTPYVALNNESDPQPVRPLRKRGRPRKVITTSPAPEPHTDGSSDIPKSIPSKHLKNHPLRTSRRRNPVDVSDSQPSNH